MRRNFFVISGNESRKIGRKVLGPADRRRVEPNLEVLKESPCLSCDLFVSDSRCPYVRRCSKIDEFQSVAAVHCTLFKPHDVFSMAKI